MVPLAELRFADYNPRIIKDHQVDQLRQSIEKFGVVEPLVVNRHKGREDIIVGGHQRARILGILGHETVPVFYVDLDEKAERELNVRLNKNTGEWDWDKLANEFAVEDLRSYGFTNSEMGVSEALAEQATEISIPNMEAGLAHECPKCGFKF